ncbi:MAG TPA: DUF4384 domain-containing protein [Cyclobacteriaceae bacterium]|nr:DUF4384 domain-containing protein [Cyclobacteriaceae bacterium]
MKKFLLFISGALVSIISQAQVKAVSNAQGIAEIVNISPEQARSKAIDEAKLDALHKAGVQEWIQSFDYLDKREEHNKFTEFFHSVTSVQTMGNVVSWKLKREQKRIDELNNHLIYEVLIDAEVKLYQTKPDLEFQISVNGIQPLYHSSQKMQFEILPNKDGYLSVFIIDQQQAVTQLFPNEKEKENKLTATTSYRFPLSPHFDYEVFTDLKEEQNYIFFLYTRQSIPFHGTSFDSLIEYIYAIEPQERFLSMDKFRIVK